MLVAALFLAAAGGGYLAYTRLWGGRAEAQGAPAGKTETYTYNSPEITTNLADTDLHFLQLKVQLNVNNGDAMRQLSSSEGRLQDIIIGTVRNKLFQDINGEDGMRRMGLEVVNKLNEMLGRKAVTDIYFVKFIVQ